MRFGNTKLQCAKVPIIIQIFISPEFTHVRLDYISPKISEQTATNLAHTFGKILDSIDLQGTQVFGDIDTLSEQNLQQIIDWNHKPPEKFFACIHDVFEQRAKESPGSPAVCAWDGELTYAELDELSSRLAHHLSSLGVKVGSYVPFCFEKSLWTVVATMAVLKAGGAFVPIDPAQPRSRVEGIIQDLGAATAVASPSNKALLEGLLDIVIVSPSTVSDFPCNSVSKAMNIEPDDTAFVLFTSGSTGKPKGIIQTHLAVCSSGLGHGSAYNVGQSTRVLQFAAHVWDVCTMDIFTTLMRGGCVCIPSDFERKNDIVGAITRMNANWAFLTPSFIKVLRPEDVRCLKTLVLGGEAVTQENIECWANEVTLFNCYGPAESAACLGVEISHRSHPAQNIGRSYPTTRCWIVDGHNHNRLAPIGAIGELVVEGPTIASGYLNNKTKTDEAFIYNPPWLRHARSSCQARIYKTGDFAQYDTDGSILFHGRRDTQVKIHGQRAELTDIAHHLSAHPWVSRSVIAFPKSGIYKDTLVAVIYLKTSSPQIQCNGPIRLVGNVDTAELQPVLEQLKHHLNKRLPLYMVPSVFLIVDNIPLNSSAKIDRKAVEVWLVSIPRSERQISPLKIRDQEQSTKLVKSEGLATELSQKLAEMAASNKLDPQEFLQGHNFYLTRAGIDSIQAISLSMFLRKKYGVKVDIERLIDGNTTIRHLAEVIQQGGSLGTAVRSLSADGLLHEVAALSRQIKSGAANRILPIPFRTNPRNVLVTGGSGYLGTQIIRQFIEESDTIKIIVHVRARTIEQGIRKIVTAAEKAKWWSAAFMSRLEVWIGNLSQSRLGLDAYQWARLCGIADEAENVHIMIHNGAAVHWSHGYETLRSTNVGSTSELLKAAVSSPVLSKFVYISGGQKLSVDDEKSHVMAVQAAASSGYSQTKFVSEMLVREIDQDQGNDNRFLVIKPSYIIGSAQQGLANTDDFIWRLLAGLIGIEGHPADDGSWLFVSEVDRIAATVVTSSMNPPIGSSGVIKILDGIMLTDLWQMLKIDLGYKLNPMNQADLLVKMKRAIEKSDKHPLFPFFYMLDRNIIDIGSLQAPRMDSAQTRRAIRKNIAYLQIVGFLPTPQRVDPISKSLPAFKPAKNFDEKHNDSNNILNVVHDSLTFGRSKAMFSAEQVL